MLESKSTMLQALGIQVQSALPDRVVATMPVDARTLQPAGLLHGGASAALIETVCSIGANLHAMGQGAHAVGVEINVNHLKGKRNGVVKCVALPVRTGRQLHVWGAEVKDEEGHLVAIGRMTLMIVRND